MTDRVAQLSKIAMDYAAEQYGPQRAGEKVWDPLTYDRKFAELIVRECGNYINSRIPGNVEVSATVAKMKQHFGVEDTAIANVLAGADQMAGDGGYREVSLKTPEFLEIQARWNALYNKES